MTHSSHPELVGAADRAGKVVREQVAAVAEAAQGTVSEIDARAREAAEATRQNAIASATPVAKEIGRIERELSELRRTVAREADRLRAKLDRSRLLNAPAIRTSARVALAGSSLPPERGALSAPEIDVGEGSAAVGEQEPGPLQEVAGEEAQDTDAAETEEAAQELKQRPEGAPASADEHNAAEAGAPEKHTSVRTSVEAHDLEGAKVSIAGASDLDLAELYILSAARAHGPFDDDGQAAYWPAVVHATVEEAIGRSDFGRNPPEDAPSGRKAKKRRARTLKPLLTARNEALRARAIGSPVVAEASRDAPVEDPPPASYEGVDKWEGASRQSTGSTATEGDSEPRELGQQRGGRPRSLLWRGARRRTRPFVETVGHCAVCGRSFIAGSEEALAQSEWLVNGQVGLCPEDQRLGWELPEGRPVPYRRGSGA